jgi:hypothetical protein
VAKEAHIGREFKEDLVFSLMHGNLGAKQQCVPSNQAAASIIARNILCLSRTDHVVEAIPAEFNLRGIGCGSSKLCKWNHIR